MKLGQVLKKERQRKSLPEEEVAEHLGSLWRGAMQTVASHDVRVIGRGIAGRRRTAALAMAAFVACSNVADWRRRGGPRHDLAVDVLALAVASFELPSLERSNR